jgi:hypothetical protein
MASPLFYADSSPKQSKAAYLLILDPLINLLITRTKHLPVLYLRQPPNSIASVAPTRSSAGSSHIFRMPSALLADFLSNPRSPLICTKVNNWINPGVSSPEFLTILFWVGIALPLPRSGHYSGRCGSFNGTLLRPRVECWPRRCPDIGDLVG